MLVATALMMQIDRISGKNEGNLIEGNVVKEWVWFACLSLVNSAAVMVVMSSCLAG